MREGELITSRRILKKMTGINEGQIKALGDLNPEIVNNPDGIPIYGLISTMFEILNNAGLLVKRKSLDGDNVALEVSIKRQNLLQLMIKNQKELGNLMSKPEMASRVLRFVYSLKNVISNSIKQTAADLSNKTLIDQRELEKIMISCYNEAVLCFQNNAHLLDWGDDGSVDTLANRLEQVEQLEDELYSQIDTELEI